jgi:RNA polymerase sigma-70 factor (ECF subfamily)
MYWSAGTPGIIGIFFPPKASYLIMSHDSLYSENSSERNPGFIMETPPQTGAINDESVLVTEAKAGNYAAFEELVNRYEKKIYRLGLNVTGNPEDAEDMLQETFLKAFEHLQDFREDSRFYTWIVRIAINQGLMKLRKRRSSKEVQMEDTSNDDGEVIPRDFADWRPNPEEELERTELEEILQSAARSLPMTFRTVFFLRDVEGLSTEETAEMLNLSEGAVKARLFRARLRLREELSKILKRG